MLTPHKHPGLVRAGIAALAVMAAFLTGCATQSRPYDYSALETSKPSSILVLPPVNHTPDVTASQAVYANVTLPLAESGYYVIPVGVTQTVLQENGIINAQEARNIGLSKLHEIFGADAVLYLDVHRYGTVYAVISSDTVVEVEGRLVDTRTGEEIWQGRASASSAEQGGSSGSLVGMLVAALVNQVLDSMSERSYGISSVANYRLLSSGSIRHGALLPGPRARVAEKP